MPVSIDSKSDEEKNQDDQNALPSPLRKYVKLSIQLYNELKSL